MGLSNENPNPSTATVDSFRATVNQMHAKNLAGRLVVYAHNDDWREAPNPNTGIRIRRPSLIAAPGRIEVTQECKDWNTSTASVGAGEEWLKAWQNPRLG
jgi:hypothetical protein